MRFFAALFIGLFALSAPAAESVFQEKGGLLVIQAESRPLVAPWVNGTSRSGYTGAGYRTWAGAPVTQWPSSNEDFPYLFKFNITSPGIYNFRAYNWYAVDYSSYFMQLDGAPTHDHYFSYKTKGTWSWNTWRDTGTSHVQPSFYLAAGIHTIAFKGRTPGYLIDRFHLYKSTVANPLSLTLPESATTGGGGTPPPPPPPPPLPPPPPPPPAPAPAPPPPPAPAPPPPPPPTTDAFTTVNDDNALIKYGGLWTDSNEEPNRINNDEHHTKNPGVSASFTFTGKEIVWVATKFSNRGQSDVYIDGVLAVMVDQYSPGVLYQQEVFVNAALPLGQHTIKIVCKGTKNTASTGFFIDVDAFKFR